MAGWDYQYSVGDLGGSFTSLSQYATVRTLSEGMGSRRGSNPVIPYRDGEFSDPFKFLDAHTVLLDMNIHYHNGSGIVDHPNGAAGHAHENASAIKNLLGYGSRNRRVLRRVDPNAGNVEALIESLSPMENQEARYKFVAILRLVEGSWRDQAATTDTQSSISAFPHAFTDIDTLGNAEIGDAKFTLTCVSAGTNPSISNDVTGETIFIPGSFSASDEIIIDLATPRSFTLNGSRYAPVNANRGWWIRLPYDTTGVPMTLDADSGTWTLVTEWRNRWL
jgi:hypothetical protein